MRVTITQYYHIPLAKLPRDVHTAVLVVCKNDAVGQSVRPSVCLSVQHFASEQPQQLPARLS